MALTKLTSNLIEGGTGTDWVTAIQTSNFTAEAGKGYFVNTTSQVLYVNLPVGVVGMEITIQDYAGTFATNKVILNANGSEKIQGSALQGKINTNNATAVLIYQDTTKGWTSQDVSLNATTISWATPTGQSLTYSAPSPQSSQGAAAATFPTTTFTATKANNIIGGTATIAGLPSGITAAQTITGSGAGNTLTVTLTGTFPATDSLNTSLTLSGLTVTNPTPLTVSYLVVAGGGGGGASGSNGSGSGGGGAGGLLTNYNVSVITLLASTDYPVVIGAGGTGGANPGAGGYIFGTNGFNSKFATIESTGGGGGASGTDTGKSGGSGGGAGYNGSGGSGTSGQGFGGGSTTTSSPYAACGGGGAGAAGAGAPNNSTGGNGGNGLQNNITGTNTYYAGGGGGGGGNNGSYTGGTGGLGGGGNGASVYTDILPGTPNTGGGGGGSGADYSLYPNGGGNGGNGGSGIVILRYPSSYIISGLTGTTITVGSDKVTSITAGTGNIQFN
jgi:hypothetical protein